MNVWQRPERCALDASVNLLCYHTEMCSLWPCDAVLDMMCNVNARGLSTRGLKSQRLGGILIVLKNLNYDLSLLACLQIKNQWPQPRFEHRLFGNVMYDWRGRASPVNEPMIIRRGQLLMAILFVSNITPLDCCLRCSRHHVGMSVEKRLLLSDWHGEWKYYKGYLILEYYSCV